MRQKEQTKDSINLLYVICVTERNRKNKGTLKTII